MKHQPCRSGERKKKDRQGNQEWLRELACFVSKTIKWLTPNMERHWEKIDLINVLLSPHFYSTNHSETWITNKWKIYWWEEATKKNFYSIDILRLFKHQMLVLPLRFSKWFFAKSFFRICLFKSYCVAKKRSAFIRTSFQVPLWRFWLFQNTRVISQWQKQFPSQL